MTQITDRFRGLRTCWFPAEIEPARPGIYRVVKCYGEAWAYWDGKGWSHGTTTPELTPNTADWLPTRMDGGFAVEKWRGLTKDVK